MVDVTFRPFDSMRILFALPLLFLVAPAMAQSSVSVNSVGGDGRVLIDPGTGQTRVVPPLLQPWQFGTIKLRPPHKSAVAKPVEPAPSAVADVVPPRKHAKPAAEAVASAVPDTGTAVTDMAPPPRKRSKPPAEAVATADTTPVVADVAPPPRKPRKPPADAIASAPPKPRQTASIAPPPAPSSGFSGFGDLETLTAAPKPVETAKPVPPKPTTPKPVAAKPAPSAAPLTPTIAIAKSAPEAKPVQKASIEPPKLRTSTAAKARDTIVFAANASDPSGTAVSSVRTLAGSLANTLGDGSARVQLMAYAGQRGEKSSDTRRLSLKRALVVRQLLIDDGVPAERIDVFALGGADDGGPLDRVDVLVKG